MNITEERLRWIIEQVIFEKGNINNAILRDAIVERILKELDE